MAFRVGSLDDALANRRSAQAALVGARHERASTESSLTSARVTADRIAEAARSVVSESQSQLDLANQEADTIRRMIATVAARNLAGYNPIARQLNDAVGQANEGAARVNATLDAHPELRDDGSPTT